MIHCTYTLVSILHSNNLQKQHVCENQVKTHVQIKCIRSYDVSWIIFFTKLFTTMYIIMYAKCIFVQLFYCRGKNRAKIELSNKTQFITKYWSSERRWHEWIIILIDCLLFNAPIENLSSICTGRGLTKLGLYPTRMAFAQEGVYFLANLQCCELFWWPVVSPSINFSHLLLLLQQHWTNFNQTRQGNSSLFKWRVTRPSPRG